MPSNNFTNIKDFVPVYIQSTYWNCSANGSPLYDEDGEPILDGDGNPELSDGTCELRFRTFEDVAEEGEDNILTNDRMWFAPGEGNSPSCLLQGPLGNEKCREQWPRRPRRCDGRSCSSQHGCHEKPSQGERLRTCPSSIQMYRSS